MGGNPEGFNFRALVAAIHQANENLSAQAGRAVNASLTLQNWLSAIPVFSTFSG